MSSEVCPFCGKSFKRLKSHLPHCKAAAGSTTAQREEPKTSTKNGTKSTCKSHSSTRKSPLDTKVAKQDTVFSAAPKISKKTKPKLSERIKMAVQTSSPASVQSSPPSSTAKSKTKIHLETQNDQESISNGSKKLNSNAEILPESILEADFGKQEIKSSVAPKSSKKTKPKLTERIKTSAPKPPVRMKSFENSQTTIETTPSSEDVTDVLANKTSSNDVRIALNKAEINLNDNFWLEDQNSVKSSPEIDPWNKRETRITLGDVRSTLRRAKQNGASKKIHFTDKICTDEMKRETLKQSKTENSLVKVQQEIPKQLMTLKISKNEITTAKSGDFMSKLWKIENADCSLSHRSEVWSDALRMDLHTLGFAAASRPLTFLEAEVSTKSFRKDSTPILNRTVDKSASDVEATTDARKRDGARSTRGVLMQQTLGQVTLRELPDWLVLNCPRRPGHVLDAAHRGWQWYYRRYIDVKRGGVGGVAMLLAGYCVLSYVWSFPRLKRDRWRKYH